MSENEDEVTILLSGLACIIAAGQTTPGVPLHEDPALRAAARRSFEMVALRERERCTKIAESVIDHTVPGDREMILYVQGRNDAAGRIAKHIREAPQ